MLPIRIALVGLSASAKTSWAAEGHLEYLLTESARAKYEIFALLNSSVSAAEAAKSTFGLPSTVRAYGKPEDVANDPDIDLVVVSTRVDTHYSIARHSIDAGKRIFVEWPMTHDGNSARELVQAARAKGISNSPIGLQTRVSPIAETIEALLQSECIGTVVSSNVHSYGKLFGRDHIIHTLGYFHDLKVGGNPITILFGHAIDMVHKALGEYKTGAWHSHMQIQQSDIKLIDSSGQVVRNVKSDVPDLLSIHGTLDGSKSYIAPNATLTVFQRNGESSFGSPNFVWTITGDRGEIRLTSPEGGYLGSGDSLHIPPTIEVQDYATGDVRQIEYTWKDWQKALGLRARNMGEVYERLAEAWARGWKVEPGREFTTMEDALVRQEQLEKIFDLYERQK